MTNEQLMALPLADEQLDKCAAAFIGELSLWECQETPGGTRIQIGRCGKDAYEVHGLCSVDEALKLYEDLSHRAAAKAFIEAYEKRDQ